MKKWAAIGLALMITASCAARQMPAPPALMVPVSVKADMARVTRGNVELVEQYKGLVRVKSDKLYFVETDLRFGEYLCVPGQAVKQGDLLARLDTEWVEEEIVRKQESIARMRQEHKFENERQSLEIAVAQVELLALAQAAASYEEGAMQAAEEKRQEIARRNLSLTQAQARQALSLQYEEESLAELQARVVNAELFAPYDGVITYMAELWPGAAVAPYDPIIYISDEKEMFVEHASLMSVSVLKNDIVKGQINGRVYDLERIPVSPQDALYYNALNQAAPLRLQIHNPDEQVRPGAYVAIWVYSAIAEDALRIPINALYTDAEIGAYVYVMENGQKVMRPIESGLRSAAYVEVKSGLNEGDEVYVK